MSHTRRERVEEKKGEKVNRDNMYACICILFSVYAFNLHKHIFLLHRWNACSPANMTHNFCNIPRDKIVSHFSHFGVI